jgi:hypothetical protein
MGTTTARAPATPASSSALGLRDEQRRVAQAPALERALPDAVPAGAVAGGGGVEADRPGRGHRSAAVVVA